MATLRLGRKNGTKHDVSILGVGVEAEHYECDLMSPRQQEELARKTGLAKSVIAAAAAEVRNGPRQEGGPRPSKTLVFTPPTGATAGDVDRPVPVRAGSVAVAGRKVLSPEAAVAKAFAIPSASAAPPLTVYATVPF